MSVSNNIKREMVKQTPLTQDVVADQFTAVFTMALGKFMDRLSTGHIEINDFVDLQRVYSMWRELNDFREGANSSGNGALPEIRTAEIKALVDSGVVSDDGEKINLEEKSQDELEAMALKMMNAINNENAGEF